MTWSGLAPLSSSSEFLALLRDSLLIISRHGGPWLNPRVAAPHAVNAEEVMHAPGCSSGPVGCRFPTQWTARAVEETERLQRLDEELAQKAEEESPALFSMGV